LKLSFLQNNGSKKSYIIFLKIISEMVFFGAVYKKLQETKLRKAFL